VCIQCTVITFDDGTERVLNPADEVEIGLIDSVIGDRICGRKEGGRSVGIAEECHPAKTTPRYPDLKPGLASANGDGTAPADADDQSYIDELRAHGAFVVPGLEGGWISSGHRMCNELRTGVPRADVAAEVTQTDPVMFMDVLQHQLCPDTLPH
jgi:Protein of unknown function (DUF732)